MPFPHVDCQGVSSVSARGGSFNLTFSEFLRDGKKWRRVKPFTDRLDGSRTPIVIFLGKDVRWISTTGGRSETAMMRYKGYLGSSKVNEKEGLIFGEVMGLRDVVTYQGRTIEEARRAFQESIDLYLETCAEEGIDPDKPFSGKLLIRTEPKVHRALAFCAKARGLSINTFAEQVLIKAIRKMAAPKRLAGKAPEERTKPEAAPVPEGRTSRDDSNQLGLLDIDVNSMFSTPDEPSAAQPELPQQAPARQSVPRKAKT
jgi:predicted HicB family RNase H-like nuclease